MSCYGSYNNGGRATESGPCPARPVAVGPVRYRDRKLDWSVQQVAERLPESSLPLGDAEGRLRQVGTEKGVGWRGLLLVRNPAKCGNGLTIKRFSQTSPAMAASPVG